MIPLILLAVVVLAVYGLVCWLSAAARGQGMVWWRHFRNAWKGDG